MQSVLRTLVLLGAAIGAVAQTVEQDAGSTGSAKEPWYDFGAEFRVRGEDRFGVGENPARQDGLGLTRLQLNMTLRPRDDFRVFVEAQDARAPGLEPGRARAPFRNTMDLRQAYVEYGRSGGPVTLQVGRRVVDVLDSRIIGGRGWSNTSPGFDGATLTLRRGKDSVSMLALTQVDILEGVDQPSRTRFVYGLIGSKALGSEDHTLEPFFLTSRRPVNIASNLGGLLRTVGSRVYGGFARNWDYQAMVAFQGGGETDYRKRSWMGVGQIGRRFEDLPARPRLELEWSYGSGDSDPDDGINETFDTFHPSVHGHYGLQDIASLRNIRILIAGVDLHPTRSVKIDLDYLDLRLASLQDGLYQLNFLRRINPPPGGAKNGFVGSEVDFFLSYKPVPRLELRLGVSRFFPGPFVIDNLPGGEPQTFLYSSMVLTL